MISNFHTALRPSSVFYEYKNLIVDHYDNMFDMTGAEYQLRVFPQFNKNVFFVVLFNPNNASTIITDVFKEYKRANINNASNNFKTKSSQFIVKNMNDYMMNNEMFCINECKVISVALLKNLWMHKDRTLDEWKKKIDEYLIGIESCLIPCLVPVDL